MFKPFFAIAVVGVLGVVGVMALAQSGAKHGGTLSVALSGDILSLDPAFAYDFSTIQVVPQMVEALQRFENSKVVPNIAERVSHPNPLTYLYQIRNGVTFWDGTPLTVDDVLFSMRRVKDPNTASPVGWMYQNVKSIEKLGERTVKVSLFKPDALWQYVGATSACAIIQKAFALKQGKQFGQPSGGIMATGAFKFVSWTTGQQVVMERNQGYWNTKAGEAFLDKVVFKVVPDSSTQMAGLKTGEINLLMGVPINLLPVAKSIKSLKMMLEPGFLLDFVAFNTGRKPFSQVKLRQALAFAFDKKKFFAAFYKDAGELAKNTPVNPALWIEGKELWAAAYRALPEMAYDLNKAKALMAGSGYKNGLTASVITDNHPIRLNAALALQAAAKTIGMVLKIKKVSAQELSTIGYGKSRDYDIIMSMWGADFPDPSANLRPVLASSNRGEGGSNLANYANPKFDALLEQQNQLLDSKQRARLMIQAQAIVARDVPLMVLNYQKNIAALSENLAGLKLEPLWYWNAFTKDMYFAK